jgi:acyl-coenzyme A synthetase/AMP-(fatty) acid ligase
MMKISSVKGESIAIRECCRRILIPPRERAREFIINGCTYESVYRLAAEIYHLKSSAKKRDGAICLCTDDKALLAAALVAALADGLPVVLPYAFSRQAVEEVMDIMPLSFILIDDSGPHDFPPGPEVVAPSRLCRDAEMPDAVVDPDHPFLLLFTGGSTGKPKTWSKTPRNVFAEALYFSGRFGITSDDVFLSTAPPRHIYGLLHSVLIPFICSARVLDGVYTYPREILHMAQTFGASVLVSVPMHYRVLKVDDLQRYNLRLALSSAGALDKEDAAHFHQKTGLDITEIYGSTETGGVATRRPITEGASWRLLDPVDCKIVEERLHVRSAFISPTLPCDQDGFFATADRADPDSEQSFILRGRADDIVKVGGKRVDMAAVQAKLKQIPGVHDAVVISLATKQGRQNELAALVVTQIDILQVRRDLAKVSEPYAVPRRMVVAPEIPVMATGKYDREAIEGILRG